MDTDSVIQSSRKMVRAVGWGQDVLCVVLGGMRMFASTSDLLVSPHLATDGFWEPELTAYLWNTLRPGMRVLNVGAHVGYYAMLAAHRVGPTGQVWAVEPDPDSVRLLRENVRMAGYHRRVHVFPMAAWHEQTAMPLWGELGHRAAASLVRTVGTRHFSAICQRLDALDIPSVDLIIVDAQGAEPQALLGMEKILGPAGDSPRSPTIVMDWNGGLYNPRVAAVIPWLMERGYSRFHTLDSQGGLAKCVPDELVKLPDGTPVVCQRHPGGDG